MKTSSSRLASCTLYNIGSEHHFPEHLFDAVFRNLFPRDGAKPTLRAVMQRDLATGIECLPYLGLPLDTAAPRVLLACQVAVGQLLLQWHPLIQMLGHERLRRLPQAFVSSGRLLLGNDKLRKALRRRREILIQRRNTLNGFDGTFEIIEGIPTGRFLPALPEPTFEDYLELEQVLRRLHIICALENLTFLPTVGNYSPDWRKLDDAVLRLYAAAYGRWVKPYEYWASLDRFSCSMVSSRTNYQVFYLQTTHQMRGARGAFTQAFLPAYEYGRMH